MGEHWRSHCTIEEPNAADIQRHLARKGKGKGAKANIGGDNSGDTEQKVTMRPIATCDFPNCGTRTTVDCVRRHVYVHFPPLFECLRCHKKLKRRDALETHEAEHCTGWCNGNEQEEDQLSFDCELEGEVGSPSSDSSDSPFPWN
jgi:hypothetical protein